MPVKHWSFAGLMLTDWCNARCASCYLCCGPDRTGRMGLTEALRYWRGLIEACPHGCRIHLSGGEPFGDWEFLIELCRRAAAEGLGPLEKIETNAFWAGDVRTIADRLHQLDAAGMGKLVISADPYHQQFVPIGNCRLLAATAEEVLGAGRVQVRWRQWLKDGFDTDGLGQAHRRQLFAAYAAGGADRPTGRAAEALAGELPCRPASEFADKPCKEALLRSRHVHVDPGGRLVPGVCAGIVLGDASRESIGEIWRRLSRDHASRPIVAALSAGGPAGLLPLAEAAGLTPRQGYAGKCHLCWDVRRHLAGRGLFADELAPGWLYGAESVGRPG